MPAGAEEQAGDGYPQAQRELDVARVVAALPKGPEEQAVALVGACRRAGLLEEGLKMVLGDAAADALLAAARAAGTKVTPAAAGRMHAHTGMPVLHVELVAGANALRPATAMHNAHAYGPLEDTARPLRCMQLRILCLPAN